MSCLWTPVIHVLSAVLWMAHSNHFCLGEYVRLNDVVTVVGCTEKHAEDGSGGLIKECIEDLKCISDLERNKHQVMCPVDCAKAVDIKTFKVKELPNSRLCLSDSSYGTELVLDQWLVWVSNGCRAQFRIWCRFNITNNDVNEAAESAPARAAEVKWPFRDPR